jgi:hypothetical protein
VTLDVMARMTSAAKHTNVLSAREILEQPKAALRGPWNARVLMEPTPPMLMRLDIGEV